MAFATLAGQALPVERGGGSELPPEVGGTRLRAYLGGRRSTIRWEKRGWQFKTVPMLPASVATLRAAIAVGAQVALNGDVVGNVAVTVDVEVQESPYVTGTGAPNNFWTVMTIRCYEV